jgi:hypothetical protein
METSAEVFQKHKTRLQMTQPSHHYTKGNEVSVVQRHLLSHVHSLFTHSQEMKTTYVFNR